jgi:hypothetical protein
MDSLSQTPLTAFFSKAGLAAGTTTTTTTSNGTTFVYCIKGKTYNATGASNGATPTTDAVTGAAFTAIALNKAGVFAWCYDTSGNLKVVQGQTVNYSDAGVFEVAPQFPGIPDTLCPIGYELVKVISTGSAWTMGVSNQASQTGITKVFVDCSTLPDRPQVS